VPLFLHDVVQCVSVGICITAKRLSQKAYVKIQRSLRDSIGTQQTFCDSQRQIECFAAVSVMLPRHAVVCLLVQVMQSLVCDYRSVFVWLPWSVVAWQQVFAQVRSCACYAGSWSSIVPTFCCTDDLQDTRYFMELICSVPAEPLPMQILALANNAGKANQVSSLQTSVADTYGFQRSPPVRHHL